MSWWEENNLRLIQTNISELNANLDVDYLIKQLKEFKANVLLLNTGGIEAFYPTELEYHYQSPYMTGDLVDKALTACHQNGIKYMARFDFSKAHESIYNEYPEWFYQSREGDIVNYNGMVHTCVNGYYQREYSLKIIKEVIERYPVDGIFFNMFGYQTRDYSGSYYGICHCHNCQKRFREMYDSDLPVKEDAKDPLYQKYLEFKEITIREMLDSIYQLVKGYNQDIAISTYTSYKVDIVKKESNTALERPYPQWLYSASENVKSVEDTWDDKIISNVCINAVGIDYRFMGVSKNEVSIRLYESIASGSGLDFCIIGSFEDYPDYDNFSNTKNIYKFHYDNEEYFGNLISVAKILLVKPDLDFRNKCYLEYLGIFKMLKEEHLQFDVICQHTLKQNLERLDNYKVIIVPGISKLDDNQVLKELKNTEANIVATGSSLVADLEQFNDIFNSYYQGKMADTRSAYIEVNNKQIFKRLIKRNWVLIKDDFLQIKPRNQAVQLLPYISPARFGPPERVGGHVKSQYHGVIVNKEDKSDHILIPWKIGYLYYQYGYQDHKYLLLDLLDHIMGEENYSIMTDAPESVEIFLNKYDGKNYILQLLNLAGFNGTTYHKPPKLTDIRISLKNIKAPIQIVDLKSKEELPFIKKDNKLEIIINELRDYSAVIINL